MRRRWLIALLVAIAAIVVAMATCDASRHAASNGAATESSARSTPDDARAPTRRLGTETTESPPHVDAAPDAPDLRITGVVRVCPDNDWIPAPGAVVEAVRITSPLDELGVDVEWQSWNLYVVEPIPGGRAATRADGTFELALPRSRRMALRVAHPGSTIQVVHIDGEDPLTIDLPRAVRQAFLVLDTEGHPIADARVRIDTNDPDDRSVERATTRSDRDGTCALDVDETAEAIEVDAAGFVPRRIVVRPTDTPLHVILERCRVTSIAGTVTDTDGHPIPAAVIALSYGLWTRSAADGTFRFDGVRALSASMDVEVWADGYPYTSLSSEVAPGDTDVRLTLRPSGTGTLRGRVEDASGRPVAGVLVEATADASTTSGADGTFELDAVPWGDVELTASRAEVVPPFDEELIVEEGSLRVALARGATVDGLRVRIAPRTLSYVRLRPATPVDGRLWIRSDHVELWLFDDGTVLVALELPPGTGIEAIWELAGESDEFTAGTVTTQSSPMTEPVVLEAPQRVSLRFRIDAPPESLGELRFYAQTSTGVALAARVGEREGDDDPTVYRVRCAPGARVRLLLQGDDVPWTTQIVTAPQTGEATFRVRPARGVRLRGRVRLASGAPYAACDVFVDRAGSLSWPAGVFGERGASTTADGTFELGPVAPGTLTLCVSSRTKSIEVRRLQVDREGVVDVGDVIVHGRGTVEGTVRQHDGRPWSGILWLVGPEGEHDGHGWIQTDVDGRFSFARPTADDLWLVAGAMGPQNGIFAVRRLEPAGPPITWTLPRPATVRIALDDVETAQGRVAVYVTHVDTGVLVLSGPRGHDSVDARIESDVPPGTLHVRMTSLDPDQGPVWETTVDVAPGATLDLLLPRVR